MCIYTYTHTRKKEKQRIKKKKMTNKKNESLSNTRSHVPAQSRKQSCKVGT